MVINKAIKKNIELESKSSNIIVVSLKYMFKSTIFTGFFYVEKLLCSL